MKGRGVLLHLSSLPTDYGIGDLGPVAFEFVDWLKIQGYNLWQILPINYCGYGNSPYNPLSSYAAFPYLISPECLYEDGLISKKDLIAAQLPRSNQVVYEAVYRAKDELFSIAVENYLKLHDIEDFIAAEADWIKPFMTFHTLSELYHSTAWFRWDEAHKHYSVDLYREMYRNYPDHMKSVAVLQAIFCSQFEALKKYIKEAGISLIGDIPLYVAYESADVWANQEIFSLDKSGERVQVAGVPPDAFSDEGQLWGNPVYRWDRMEDDNFQWFRNRLLKALSFYDYLRLDHFIGYVNYWSIPAGEVTAINGGWIEAKPERFFASLVEQCGAEKFIAEDLGVLTPEVCAYRDRYGFPGMIILQFCFDDRVPDIASFPANKIIFSGTHDNQTTRGWFETYVMERPQVLANLEQYLMQSGLITKTEELSADSVSSMIVRIAEASPCETSIIPMQDLLGLADEARMNIPGTALGNWQWRMGSSFPVHTV